MYTTRPQATLAGPTTTLHGWKTHLDTNTEALTLNLAKLYTTGISPDAATDTLTSWLNIRYTNPTHPALQPGHWFNPADLLLAACTSRQFLTAAKVKPTEHIGQAINGSIRVFDQSGYAVTIIRHDHHIELPAAEAHHLCDTVYGQTDPRWLTLLHNELRRRGVHINALTGNKTNRRGVLNDAREVLESAINDLWDRWTEDQRDLAAAISTRDRTGLDPVALHDLVTTI